MATRQYHYRRAEKLLDDAGEMGKRLSAIIERSDPVVREDVALVVNSITMLIGQAQVHATLASAQEGVCGEMEAR